jgi:quaternary ammonium compound-resistance protein SugE
MAWVVLFLASLFEVGWAVGLKANAGFARPVMLLATLGAMIASVALLAVAMRTLPLGTAYAVWTGLGIIGTALLGILLYGESASLLQLACIGLIVVGVVGLKLLSP